MSAGPSPDGTGDKGWVEVQRKTFTNWVNDKLKETEYNVQDITIDLKNGVVLITLLMILAPGKKMPGKMKKNPQKEIHMTENLSIGLKFLMDVEKIPLVNIGVMDIFRGDLKLTLALIWALILHYQIAGPAPTHDDGSPESKEAKKKRKNAKKLMLDWVNAALPMHNVSNFTSDWNDGIKLSALVDYCKPGLIPNHASLDPADRLNNVKHAMDLAENELGVPQVLHPEDLAVNKPDEHSVMTYVSGFCRPDSAGQNSLMDWVNSKIPNRPVSNLTTDWTDGTALAALVDSLTEGDFAECDKMKEDDKYKNCRDAIDAGHDKLGVECKFEPEDFAENSMDQITRSTYLTKYRTAAKQDKPTLASQMKAVGPGITGDSVGKDTSFVVRGPRIPHWAKIGTTVKGPDGSELPTKQQNTSFKATQVQYSPEVPGDYTIDVDFNGEPIPGSTFKLNHIPPTNVDGCVATGNGLNKARVGETAGFTVNCEEGGPGELQVDIETPSGNLESEVEEATPKNYSVNFNPIETGEHVISVLWDNKNIPYSPFSCNVTDPKQCSVSGTGLHKGSVGQPQVFTVRTDKAGSGDLAVDINGPSGPVDSDVKEVTNNVFNVTYVPKEPGPHEINVSYADDPIMGSPFISNVVIPPDASKCQVSNLPVEGMLRAGKEYSFDVDASGAGSGELLASSTGQSVPKPCTVKDSGSGLYSVNFLPEDVGPLKVEASYGGQSLSQFPMEFTVNDPTKVQVNRKAIEAGIYYIDQPLQFKIDASQAGEGDVSASSNPGGSVPLKDQGGRSYLFDLNLSTEGDYHVTVMFDGEEVPDTPIHVVANYRKLADSVVVTQPQPSKIGAFLVDTPYEYKVITMGAGHADLDVTSIGQNSQVRPVVKVTKDADDHYTIALSASEPDVHDVNIQWAGEHVPGSPFKLHVEGKPEPEKVVCTEPLYTVGSSEPVVLEANAENAGAGNLTASCHGNASGDVPVDVIEKEPKKYVVSFKPPKHDIYTLNVMWLKSDVRDSPFKINLIPPDSSKCTVTGPDVPVDPTEPILLHVDASNAGNGEIAASAIGDKTGEKPVTIEEVKPKVFVLSFVPELTDFYTMEVVWGGQDVPGAPFRVHSSAANADKVHICEPPTAMLEAGQAIGICFDTSAGGVGVLTATGRGEKIGEIPVTVRQRSIAKEKYDVKFLPSEPDVYIIKVLWSGMDVKGSPFTINLMPVDVKKVKVIGPNMPRGVGGPVELMLQTEGAGKGKVTGTCSGKTVGPVEVVIRETSTDVHELCFIPPKPDIYTFPVQYGGQKLVGSPFIINTLPSNASSVKVKEPDSIAVSKSLMFNVDASEAGSGDLTTTCEGETSGPIKISTTSAEPGYYDVTFIPQKQDLYTVNMEWDGNKVPGSPFTVDLRPPMADKVKVGELHIPDEVGGNNYVWVDLDCSEAGHGPLKADAKGASTGRMPVEADRLGRSTYRMKFPPKEADVYIFAVAYGDSQVTGSPFKINLVPPDASRVKHTKTTLSDLEGGPVSMFFDTTKAGRGEMTAEIWKELMSTVPNKVEQLSFTEHKITFLPDVPDVYDVEVKWSGSRVPGSPFKVDTRPPLKPELLEIGRLIYTDINEPASLTLNTYKAGPGKVTAKCVGPDDQDVNVDIEKPTSAEDDYKISLVPKAQGKYSLSVFFDGKGVQEDPFSIDLTPVMEPCDQIILENTEESMFIPEDMATFDKELEDFGKVKEPEVECVIEPTLEVGNPFYIQLIMEPEMVDQEVTAVAHGDNTGNQEVELTKSDGDGGEVYNMYFNPRVPDRYTIKVEHNGSPIKDSPFIVNYIFPVDASKCRIFGLQKIPASPHVREPITFGVDAKEAGRGKLSVSGDGPSAEGEPSALTVNPSVKGEPQVFDIVYVPTAMGKHHVHLLWSGESIPGSPLTFQVGDRSKMQRFPYGKPVTLDITADSAKSLDAHAIHEDSGNKLKVKVSKERSGQFKLAFQPKHPGVYAIHVSLKKNPIPGSPFRIVYLGPSKPEGVKVHDFPEQGTVNVPLNFSIDTEEAGTGELGINLEGPESVKDSDITYTPREEVACYDISYVPKTAGGHKFHITWAGKPIPSGPFVTDVVDDTPTCTTVLSGNATNVVEVGEPVTVTLTSNGPQIIPESISAECEGDKSGATGSDVEVKKKEGEDKYVVQCTPTAEDNYSLSVTHKKKHIEGSPFSIKAVNKDTLSPDYVHSKNPEHCDIEAGSQVNVIRKHPDPSGGLTVSVMGPYENCPSFVTTDEDGNAGIHFDPTVSGDYIISAEDEKGHNLPGCPCKVTVGQKPADPTKVGVLDDDMAVFNEPIPFGQPARFRISTVDAGPGTLNITSRGPGKATVKVFDNKDGTYTCDFSPSIAGKYHIDILWNDDHIRGSPYTLHFKSKKEKVIAGLNLENESFRIDVPHRFKLHCGEVGEGILELTCKPPSASKIRLIPLPKTKNSYQCEILPKEVGNHEIMVLYNGKHILGSPFNVQFDKRGDATKCAMIESSVSGQNTDQETVNFLVSSEGAGKGKMTASVSQTSSKTTLPVTVKSLPDSKHSIEFSPKENEEYLLNIKYDNQHIPGSPFKLMFGGDKADAIQCSAQGDGIEACIVDKEAQFTVTSAKPNQGEISITITGEDGSTVTPSMKNLEDKKTEVTYTASAPGKYDVSIQWANEDILGSPFQVQCYNPSDPSRFVIENPPSETFLGSPFSFTVKSLAGFPDDGSLLVSAQSSQNTFYHGKVEAVRSEESPCYNCTLDLPELGKYLIYTRWSGSHIKNSPFKLKVVSPPKPENVKAYGPGLENGYVGQEGNFTVETEEAGTGTLAVRVHGPKGAFKINMRRHPDNDRTILVRYDPNHVGKYSVDITWSDTHVPGSPFEVEFTQQ